MKSKAGRPSALFYVLLGAALLVFIQTFALLAPILLSLLLILLISLALNPVIARMRAWTGGRKGAAGLLALAVVGVMGLTGWAFSVPMKDSVTQFVEQLPAYWERLQRPLIKLEQQAVNSEQKLQAEVTTEIAMEAAAAGEFEDQTASVAAERPAGEAAPPESETESGSVRSGLGQMLEGVLGRFTAVAFNGAQILIVLVTVFFGVFYTLMNPRPIFWAVFSLVPDRHHDQALTIVHRIGEFVPRWAGATLIGMVTVGLLVFLLMWVVFAYLGIQALENNVIVPFVMAHGLKLHPLAVIFSMLLCVAAFGVLGVLVAAPLVAIVSILHDELYRKRFLAKVTDADLEQLSRQALHENVSAGK